MLFRQDQDNIAGSLLYKTESLLADILKDKKLTKAWIS
jgi:hypothetical protein